MATGAGNRYASTSALLPAPSARGRDIERHKQTFPVTSEDVGPGGPGLAQVKCVLCSEMFAFVPLEGKPAGGSGFVYRSPACEGAGFGF